MKKHASSVSEYYGGEFSTTTARPVNMLQTIGVSVRWLEKMRSVIFSLSFFALLPAGRFLFCVKACPGFISGVKKKINPILCIFITEPSLHKIFLHEEE